MNLQRAQMIASDLMKYYLSPLQGWGFRFDHSLTRLGLCDHRNFRISLGRHATEVNSEEQVLMTIVHEIAHALVGSLHGHDDVWKAKAIELGHSGERCGKIAVKAPAKYSVTCHSCRSTWNLYRLTKRYKERINVMWCQSCGKQRSQGKLFLEKTK